MTRIWTIVILTALTGIMPVHADTLRCGSSLVSAGMTIAAVLEHCGEPDSRTTEERPVRSGARIVGSYEAEIWTYDRGTGQFPAVLEFANGKLESITLVRN